MNHYGRKNLEKINEYSVDFNYQKNCPTSVIKLDANECSNLLSAKELESVFTKLSNTQLNYYPDPNYNRLKDVIESTFGFASENIFVGNGTDDIINNLFVAFYGMKMLLPDVTYPVYRHLAKLYDIDVFTFPLKGRDFELTEDINCYIEQENIDLVALSYPNNPTGNCFSPEVIEMAIQQNPSTLFLVDEAYFEFCQHSFAHMVPKHNNLIVTRTLSKAYGLAGLRLGFCVAQENVIRMLKKIELPYSMNSISQELGALIIPKLHKKIGKPLKHLVEERDRIRQEINQIKDLYACPSATNFLFVSLPANICTTEMDKMFKKSNIYLRFFNFDSQKKYIRFTIGSPEENDKVIAYLKNFFQPAKNRISNTTIIPLFELAEQY